jgi:hypothetical protein
MVSNHADFQEWESYDMLELLMKIIHVLNIY